VLDKEELGKMKASYATADSNRDGRVTQDELAAHLTEFSRGSQATTTSSMASTERPRGPSAAGRSDDDRRERRSERLEIVRRSYRFLTPTERLTETLPSSLREWFLSNDRNGDGQVAMSEYAASWSEDKVSEFRKLDLNNDGRITPQEYVRAKTQAPGGG
jgi:Ca2+-binding EF-hand superfamily protein